MTVQPTTDEVLSLLAPELVFTETQILRGYEAKVAKRNGQKPIREVEHVCYSRDLKNRLCTSYGFVSRLSAKLKAAGYKVGIKDLDPHPKPKVLEPHWDRVFSVKGLELRHGQDEFLAKIASSDCGRFDCPPGYGKSFLIGLIGRLYPKARIDVVSRRVPVLRDRIYAELCSILPDVGMIGAGKYSPNHRVLCITAGSIHRAPGDADILIGDECHELATDRTTEMIGRLYYRSRNFGLSATQDKRLDNRDKLLEGIFGPIIYSMDYQEALDHGMVVPISVEWHSMVMDVDPCSGLSDVPKKRYGLWRNEWRNAAIAENANEYDADTQVLITVETIEHAVNLKSFLPDYTLVYSEAGLSGVDREKYVREGLISSDEPEMTSKRRQQLTKDFEAGKVKKAIATTVWNVGVDFKSLSVLIRADGGASPISSTQIPGRVSRISEDKKRAVVHDYMDQFNHGFRRKARQREADYASNGWQQSFPKKQSERDFGS